MENIHVYNEDHIRIKDIQDILKDKECCELEYADSIVLVITNEQIFVKRWAPGDPDIPNLVFWDDRLYRDDYNDYDILSIEDFEYEELENILHIAFRECRYSIENSDDELNKFIKY